METQIPQPARAPIGNQYPPQGHQAMMMGMRNGVAPIINPYNILPEQQQDKKRQFAKSVYVSGFEKTVTTAMLERHFSSVRPVHGIKLPTTKFDQNKGFAFIYYGSEDDANLAKKELDRTAILIEKIRVTKTVVSENLSKMIFKIKVLGLNDKQIEEIQKTYFNQDNLEKQVDKIISPIFGKNVEINKIIVPAVKGTAEKKGQTLSYARVFFYISNLKEAVAIVRRLSDVDLNTDKNEYEQVLEFIMNHLNKEETFRKNATAEIYEYTKKNRSNVLHLKGVQSTQGESMLSLAEELKNFIQGQNMQWNIINSYCGNAPGKGVWANVTFATYEDTKKAYEHLKTVKPEFKGKPVYGSLRNVIDLRTVVFSVIKKDVKQAEVDKFLQEIASNSQIIPSEVENAPALRKFEYFSFNIIEQTKFYMDNDGKQVGIRHGSESTVQASWRFNNIVPRRLVVHFFNDIVDQDLRTLLTDIRVNPKHTQIFMVDDKKSPLRGNHQRGHIKDSAYVKHAEINRERKKRNMIEKKPQRQQRDNQGQFQRGPRINQQQQQQQQQNVTAPRIDFNMLAGNKSILGSANMPKLNPSNMRPPMGGLMPNMKVPPMGMSGSSMGMGQGPMMGVKPPMGMGQPIMGQPMGMNQTPMMGKPPMMSQPPMMGGNIPPQMGQRPNIPPQPKQ